MTEWQTETDYANDGAWRLALKITRVLNRERTPYQEIALFENPLFGRVLTLDGIVQATERDEFFYHEMAVHPAMLAHGGVKRVLIVGGGDGGALEEVMKYPDVAKVTLVEIDEAVVKFCRRHLRSVCADAFEDPRLDLTIDDGVDYVAGEGPGFDFILVDSTDPIGLDKDDPRGPAARLFSTDFYRDCRRRLREGGILVTQNAVPFVDPSGLTVPVAHLRSTFADVACYRAVVPSYYGGEMVFTFSTDDPAPRRCPPSVLADRLASVGLDLRYYTPEVHVGAFALPGYLRDLLT